MTNRVNRAIQLLTQYQAIYYDGAHSGHVLTYAQGREDATTWADYINVGMEHGAFDMTGHAEYWVLLLLANYGKEGRPEPIIAKVSQETLAEMIGTTRSRVSHFMNKFRQLGFIEYNGALKVHSSLLSVVLHDQPQIRRDGEEA